MRIDEIGLVLEGIPLLSVQYYGSENKEVDNISKSALVSSLLQYAENVISSVEYFESSAYSMIFKKGMMSTARSPDKANIFSYIIIDRRKKELPEKRKQKIINLLSVVLNEFIERYKGVETSEVSKFKDFKKFINDTFGDLTKSVDDKFSSLFTT
jgi:hypothetical protein